VDQANSCSAGSVSQHYRLLSSPCSQVNQSLGGLVTQRHEILVTLCRQVNSCPSVSLLSGIVIPRHFPLYGRQQAYPLKGRRQKYPLEK
jgi:hypothetical protein